MQKRILSMILSLSIVASLFAGLSFSAFAANSDKVAGNTVVQETSGMDNMATRDQWLDGKGYNLSTSLIRNTQNSDAKVYYYISSQEENPTFAGVNGLTYGERTLLEINDTKNEVYGIDVLTKPDTTGTGDTRIVGISDLQKRMFLTYKEGTEVGVGANVEGVVKDESKQYLQINFELPAEADISSYVLPYAGSWNAHYTRPGVWKVLVADTEDGLWGDTNLVSYVDNTANAKRVVGVNLGTAKRGKWVGLRLICPYNDNGTPNYSQMSNLVYIRLARFGLFGTYVKPATTEGITAVGSNDNGESEATAVATLAGNTDKNGAYPSTTVALTARESYKGSNSKIYTFDGWYLGEDKIAEKATANYTLTGAETTKEFTAKYTEKEYEEYPSSKYNLTATHYAGQLTNNPIADSLIVGKMPVSAHIFNTIEGDYTVSNEPQDYTSGLASNISNVTSATVNNGDAHLFSDVVQKKTMFVDTVFDGTTLVSMTATDDESKQWVQINYELDGEADIDNILFGRYAAGSKWDVGHFKLILSDTEEGLYTLSSAKAVIEVDSGTQTNKANWNFQFKEDITAKYVGVRIISMYNNNYGEWTKANYDAVYPRFTHLGVHGTYVDAIGEVGTVTATTEDEALKGLVSASDVVYGNPDKNGDYASAEVTVKAEATYSDDAYDYTFAGWFVGEDKYTDDAEFVYDATKGDADFVAKYDQTKKIIYHTVTVWWWNTNHVGDYQVADGEVFDITLAEADLRAQWPTRFAEDKYIELNYDDDPITADTRIDGVPRYRARFFEKDGTTLIEEVWHNANAKPLAPKAPEVEGYTFTGWDKEITATEPRDYIATYDIKTYTVTFKAEGAEDIVKTVNWGETLTDIPEVPYKENYNGVWEDVDLTNIKENKVVNAVYTLEGFVVTFESAAGVELGTVVVEDGQIPDINEVRVINEKVANIYGYEIAVNEAGDVIWDKDVYAEGIVSNITVRPFYKAKDISTAITLYNLDSKTEYYDHHTQQYDTAITLSCEGAKSWVDENGNVLLDTAEGVLYACGSRMKLYPVSEQKTAPAVAIVGKVNDGDYSVFAHVNVENATEYGVVFSSSQGYSLKNEFTVEDAIADATGGKRYKRVQIDATKVGQVDFMATLNGTGDKTRYARAYVKVGEDYIYTDAICNK